MTRVRKLGLGDYREQTWRNGRGRTLEIALGPPEAAAERLDYAWRLAAAGVAEDGPFSDFHGYERLLVVTHGAGLELEFAAEAGAPARRERMRRLEALRFPGTPAPRARLTGGPVEDLGLLYRPLEWSAELGCVRLAQRTLRLAAEGTHLFVHALGAAIRARVSNEDEPFELGARETLWLEAPARGDEVELTGSAAACELVWVALVRR
jgi:environmental stress-induced protein Ves